MSLRHLACLTSLALTMACGGGGALSVSTTPPPSNTPLAADTAEAMANTFLLAEFQQSSLTALPTLVTAGEPGVYALVGGAGTMNCATSTATGASTILMTFNGCMGPNGGMLTGQMTFSWKPNECTLTYQNLKAAKGTQAWLLNGTKVIQINTTAKQAAIAATGMTLAFTDTAAPSTNKTMTYGCSLTSDWATAGSYKLWGQFTTQKGSDPALSGLIASTTPLTWTATCCYPGSGTMNLQQGMAKADLAFGLPCGTLSIMPFGQTAMMRTLAACP